jgi:hypothetical protein
METTKYGKYIITDTDSPPEYPRVKGSKYFNTLYNPDELKGTLKNAFYLETNIVTQPFGEQYKPHAHDFDEYLVFLGTNPDDPFDLGGELEIWLGGEERHIITKTCAIFVPRGMYHCPFQMLRVDRPIIFFTTGNGSRYSYSSLSNDPRWAHLPDFIPGTSVSMFPKSKIQNS